MATSEGTTAVSSQFTVLNRSGCHLCDDFLAALRPLQAKYGFSLDVIDVDRHPELEARFGERVPVLLAREVELCHYYLDMAAVRACLLNFR